jgi:hypothetical protein
MSTPRPGETRNVVIATENPLPAANELVAYWRQKQGGRGVPRRRDVDPTSIPPRLLPHLFMLDVIDRGADFRYRLIGTAIVAGVGRDATGALVSRLYGSFPDALAALRQILGRVMTEKIPIFSSGLLYWLPERDYQAYTNVFLPLSSDGVQVDIVLGGLWIVPP